MSYPNEGAMFIVYFALGCGALNILAIILGAIFFGPHDDDCDCCDCSHRDDDRPVRDYNNYSTSNTSSSSEEKYNPNPPAWSATPPPNLDHWYYG